MEEEILNRALNNAQKEVPVQLYYTPYEQLNGSLTAHYKNQRHHYRVVVKKEVRSYIVNQLINEQWKNEKILLIAERIPSRVKAALREEKIPYIEANGNIFIEMEDMFLLVDTNQPLKASKERGNRAFTKTGLKVLLHFLIKPDLINQPQREIAAFTGVGLGNIPQVINGLRETGFLLPISKKKYTWGDKEELLSRWVHDYQTILKPTLKKKTYKMRVPWQEIQLNDDIAVWGAEPAADLLTNYLRPEKFILYTNEAQANLIRNYKLQPKNEGDLEVIEMFWNEQLNEITAPPIIVYAELLLEGGKRNKETAEKIFNEHIKPNL